MIKKWNYSIVLCLALAVVAEVKTVAEESVSAKETAQATVSLGVVAVGDVAPEVVEQVVEHMRSTLLCDIQVLEARETAGEDNLQAEAATLADAVGKHRGVVAFAKVAANVEDHGAFLPEQKVGLLSVTGLQGDGGTDQLVVRLKKESIHCGGMLLGMSRCPNSRCALWQYRNDEGLEFKGDGFCPPCQKRIREVVGSDA